MTQRNRIYREYWRAVLVLGVGVLIGLLIGQWQLCLTVAALSLTGWHVMHLARLWRWLQDPDADPDLDAPGLWGDVYSAMLRRKKRDSEARQRLAEIIERFQRATKVLPDAVAVLKPVGELEAFNRAAGEMLGLRYPDDLGQPITNFVRAPEFVELLALGDLNRSIELESPTDASRHLSLQVIPYADPPRILLVGRDITQLHRLNVMRQDFVANVSHELKTPLTVISGYIEALETRLNAGEFERTALATVGEQTRRMRSLVDDLLQLAAMETTEPTMDAKPVDVASIATELRTMSEQVGDGAHAIRFEIDGELAIRGSRRELTSAFSNLLLNAMRFTTPGDPIVVRWSSRQSDPSAGPSALEGVFEVIDRGEGIPAVDIPRITERFYRVDSGRSRQEGGTGLGLAIVKHVVQRHNGELFIDSTLGEGTRIECVFPRERVVNYAAPDRSHIHLVPSADEANMGDVA